MPVNIDVPGLGPVSIPDDVPVNLVDDYVSQIAKSKNINLPAPAPAPAPERTFGQAVSDIGASTAGGLGALVALPGQLTGIAGLTDMDNALTRTGAAMQKFGQEHKSEQLKQMERERAKKIAAEDTELGKAWVAFKETGLSPALFTSFLAEQAPQLLVGGVGAKAAKLAATGAAKVAGRELGEAALEKAATSGAVGAGVTAQGADIGSDTYQSVMKDKELDKTPEYKALISQGLNPDEARKQLALSSAQKAAAGAGVASYLTSKLPGGRAIEEAIAGKFKPGIIRGIATTAPGEFVSEGLEEGLGQVASNIARPGEQDITAGVGEAAAMGALGGLGMGTGVGALSGMVGGARERQQQAMEAAEEQAKQELDARTPPVEQIEHPDPVQLAPEQVRNTAQELVSNIQPGSAFTLDDITNTTGGAIAGADAAAVANDLLNRGEIVREPGDTLSFRRVNDDERVIPLGNSDQSYVYTVPTTREGSEINDGYAVESQALGVTRNVANQEEADQLKQLMLNRAGEQAAVVDEQINNLREQEQQVTRTIEEAMLRSDVTGEQLQGLKESGQQASEKIKQEIAKLEEQKAAILAEPVVTPINPRAEAGHQVRLHIPGQPARVLSNFATEQEAYDAIIDNASPEQERSIVEDPAYEGVRNRLEERAAQLEEEPEEAPVEMTPEMQQRVTEVSNRMRGVLDQMGLKGIGLNVQQRLQEVVNGKLTAIDGKYLNRIISASLEGYEDSRDVTGTIGHETIHALRELGMFSDKEWEILTKKAKSEWIKKYDIENRYEGVNLSDEKVIEEAIADAFGDWLQGNLQERGVVSGLFNRIKLFLQKVGDVLRGQGFTSSEDIFKRTRAGKLQGERVERTSEGAQFALKRKFPSTVNVEGKERPTGVFDSSQLKVLQNEDFDTYSVYGPDDERIGPKFETVDEARDLANSLSKPIHPTVEGVENFWRWFGNSKTVNRFGVPQVWYHGTARDISKFEPKQAKSIFLTQDPEFAEDFSGNSLNWMITNADKIVDEQTLRGAVLSGLQEALRSKEISKKEFEEYRQKPFKSLVKTRAVSLLMDDENMFGVSPIAIDYVRNAVRDVLPSAENIVPLFVRAEKPFDYHREEDIADFRDWLKTLDENNPARIFLEDEMGAIMEGSWERIESPAFQMFLKERGYDSFFVTEGGKKNLAVYDPNQLKSAVGNAGAFSRDSGEIQYALPLTSVERDEIVRRSKNDFDLAKQMLRFAQNMTPQEREKLSRANAVKMIDLLGRFPDANEYAAVAFAGRAKRGWYKQSAETLISVFGYDAPRFAGLLAALSPQCSVETNLTNALNLWKNWTAAGRPTNRKAILKIAGDSVQGDKGEESVLDAWKNNSERALTIENVNDLVLSGPKVNSFYQNLIGVTYEVTNDAWMANFAFLDQKLFSGSLTGKYDPGKRPGYLTQSVIVREAADILTKKTGREWTPAEVQETVWSWAKALYEGAEAEGIAPIQFLTEGKLTDELINAVPDFGTLFYSPEYESILREAGYGKQLDALIQQRDRAGEQLPEEKRVAEAEAEPFGTLTQKRLVTSAAKRLGELKAFRDRQAEIERRLKGEAVVTFEIRPSESLTALVPEIHDADPKMKKKFADGAYDILFNERGEDKLAMLLGHISKLRKIGSGGFEGKIHPNYQVAVPEEDANAYAAATGYVFLQDAVPWQKPRESGSNFGIAVLFKEEKGQPRRNIEAIERDFFDALDKLTGTGHTRNGKTFYVGNFTSLDNETFKDLILQIASDVGIKHKIEFDADGYNFDGNYLSNSIEAENGKTINAWTTEEGGAGYLQGDGGERLANLQNSLDAMQSEFIRYCQDFREAYLIPKQKVTRGKKPKKDVGQLALPRNVLGQPATLPTWTDPTDSKTDDVRYLLQDKMIDVKRVVQEITKAAGVIADRWNPYLQEELYHGRTAQQTERFLRTELRPLFVDLAKHNITTAEFEEFLHNRHAKERNDQIASINPSMPDAGSGIATQAAQNYLNALPPARRRLLDSIAQKIDNINRGTRQILVKSGLETPQTIASWEQTYPNYVPLFREDADYVTSSGYGVGQGFNIRGDFSKRTTGSTRNVVDILANVVMQRERAIVRAEKNRVAEAIYGLAVQNPNKGFWLAIDPDAIKDVSKIQNELINLGISPNDIQNIFQQPKKSTIDPRTGLVTNKLDPFVLNSDNILATRINGRNHYVLFNNNNPRAKRMVTALKNLDADQLGRVMSIMGTISRWISSVNTQYNPVFGVINFFRDVQGAALNLSTTPIADKLKDVMSAPNLTGALKGIWDVSRAEKSGAAMPNSKWANLWQDLQNEGGQTGYRSMYSSSEERAKAIQKEINQIGENKLKHAGRAMIDVLSDYNTSMENAVRLTAYKAALDKGLSKQQAASIAKNLTVNFNRKGQIATQAGALYAFFNASVQGSSRLIETLTGPMGKKIIGGGLLLGGLQAVMLAAAGFDEDEPPEFLKERNFVIPIGGKKYISIPMPLGFNLLPNTSRNLVEWGLNGFHDSGKTIVNITGSAIESFNPIGGGGWSLQTVAPTALDPVAALAENKDAFGRPIYKKDLNPTDPTPGYLRTKDTATTWSKSLSEFLNMASGGTKYKPGVINVTPDQIDYLVGQAGGGVAREISKVEQTISSAATGEELPPYKIPLVGRFYGSAESNAAQSQKYYENITRLNEHENEIKGRRKNHEPVYEYIQENPEARLVPAANAIENRIKELRQQKKRLVERGATPERVKQINDRIVTQMKRLNEQVARIRD
jgi:hypothetical protein